MIMNVRRAMLRRWLEVSYCFLNISGRLLKKREAKLFWRGFVFSSWLVVCSGVHRSSKVKSNRTGSASKQQIALRNTHTPPTDIVQSRQPNPPPFTKKRLRERYFYNKLVVSKIIYPLYCIGRGKKIMSLMKIIKITHRPSLCLYFYFHFLLLFFSFPY